MESAMLYNLPILFGLFVVIAGLRCAFPDILQDFALVIPLFAAFYGWMWCDVSKECVVILCLVSNAINTLLIRIIPLGFLKTKSPFRFGVTCFLGLFVLVQILGVVYARLVLGRWWMEHWFDAVLYIYSILVMYLSLFLLVGFNKQSSEGKVKVTFVSLVALSIPVMVAGPVTLMAWERETRKSSWYSLCSTLVPVCTFCWIRTSTAVHRASKVDTIRSILIAVSVLSLCPSALARGNGYYVTDFVSVVAWVDIAINVLLSYVRVQVMTD
jgi:hypothetical protein